MDPSSVAVADPVAAWHSLVAERAASAVCAGLADRMRERRLTFGGRLLCPFLRPFFLEAAELLWTLGERVAARAMEDATLLEDLALSPEEIRLARIDPGYQTTSTAA